MAFLPAQTEPLADLMSFNIIGYKAPQEMGTAWNLLSYTGLFFISWQLVLTLQLLH